MNNSTYRFTLDLQKHQSQMSVAVFRHDTAVRLVISLTDGGKPYFLEDGCYARLFGKRPDDAEFSHPCMIKDNTEIIYDFLPSASYVEGIVNCQLRVYGTEREFITAPRFTIVVDERVVDDSDTDIDDETLTKLDDIFASEAERVEAEKKRKGAYIRYSQYPDGTDFTADWHEGYNYVGFATAKECPTEKGGFTWCLFKGNKGDQGEQGIQGEKGKTPEKGVDYFTDGDKAEMITAVMEAIGTPVYGTVDENKHILLSGRNLVDGSYTCSIEMENGNIVPIGAFEKDMNAVVPTYPNQIPISTDIDGSTFNDIGYMEKRRLGSSYTVSTLDNENASSPAFVTGFIPVKEGDVITLENCYIDSNTISDTSVYGHATNALQIGVYGENRLKVGSQNNSWDRMGSSVSSPSAYFKSFVTDANGHTTQFAIINGLGIGINFIRLTLAAKAGYTAADAIVTVRQASV